MLLGSVVCHSLLVAQELASELFIQYFREERFVGLWMSPVPRLYNLLPTLTMKLLLPSLPVQVHGRQVVFTEIFVRTVSQGMIGFMGLALLALFNLLNACASSLVSNLGFKSVFLVGHRVLLQRPINRCVGIVPNPSVVVLPHSSSAGYSLNTFGNLGDDVTFSKHQLRANAESSAESYCEPLSITNTSGIQNPVKIALSSFMTDCAMPELTR